MTLQEFWNQYGPYIGGLFLIIITGLGVFLKSWFEQKAKLTELETKSKEQQVRLEEIDVDETERKNRLDAEAREFLQKLAAQYFEDTKRMNDEMRHQRDLIDYANSENARKDAIISDLKDQQQKNVDKLSTFSAQIQVLQVAAQERDTLKQQVQTLENRVKEMQETADRRHVEMSKITGQNLELNTKFRAASEGLQKALKALEDCYTESGKPMPPLADVIGAMQAAVLQRKEGVE